MDLMRFVCFSDTVLCTILIVFNDGMCLTVLTYFAIASRQGLQGSSSFSRLCSSNVRLVNAVFFANEALQYKQ